MALAVKNENASSPSAHLPVLLPDGASGGIPQAGRDPCSGLCGGRGGPGAGAAGLVERRRAVRKRREGA